MIDSLINKNIEHIALKLKTLPEQPGVYQHLDESGKIIYVGKARNLKNRVSSYFSHYDDKSAKIKMLVRHISDFRFTVVDTEIDALLLENSLIKQHQPRYNSLLKDDKSYPYLCITDEDYPQLLFVRNRKHKGQYFGPYPNQKILAELQDIIKHIFPYRTCTLPLRKNSTGIDRPCMKYQIGLCKAPCVGYQSYEEYRAMFCDIRKILNGDFGEILQSMKKQMLLYADELKFEEAEVQKKKIRLLTDYQSKSTVVDTAIKDVDVVSILSDSRFAYVNMMRIKCGSVVYCFSSEIKKQLDESDEGILSTVFPQLHEQTGSTAREVVLPLKVNDLPEDYIKQTIPSRGAKKELLDLSIRNVVAYKQQREHHRALVDPDEGTSRRNEHLLERIQHALKLTQLPVNIECFDNSNIQGAYPVAAMVRFTNGKPNRKEYRKFNIKTVEGPDDYSSMAEVIYRRYKRLSEESLPLPQLLIVDGGIGQMSVAHQVIKEQLQLDIPIAGLVKNDRHRTSELLFGFPPQVIGMKPNDPLFLLLEQIQNEVHRFAITFHKNKRSKGTIRTQLTDIQGIGEVSARELLLKFGSVKQIAKRSIDELAQVIGNAKAKLVYDFFNLK